MIEKNDSHYKGSQAATASPTLQQKHNACKQGLEAKCCWRCASPLLRPEMAGNLALPATRFPAPPWVDQPPQTPKSGSAQALERSSGCRTSNPARQSRWPWTWLLHRWHRLSSTLRAGPKAARESIPRHRDTQYVSRSESSGSIDAPNTAGHAKLKI